MSGREEVAARVADEARKLIEKHNVVAAVVNRVNTALRCSSV